jgi:hypothetical protein
MLKEERKKGRKGAKVVSRLGSVVSVGNRPLPTTTLSFLSSRAKPRDLRFRGPFLEMFFELWPRPVIGGDQPSLIIDEEESCAAIFQLTGETLAAVHVAKLDCFLI